VRADQCAWASDVSARAKAREMLRPEWFQRLSTLLYFLRANVVIKRAEHEQFSAVQRAAEHAEAALRAAEAAAWLVCAGNPVARSAADELVVIDPLTTPVSEMWRTMNVPLAAPVVDRLTAEDLRMFAR
jgi:hypothetical protein